MCIRDRHSATRIYDLMLKSKYAPNEVHTFNSLLQYYDGEADMPGGPVSYTHLNKAKQKPLEHLKNTIIH